VVAVVVVAVPAILPEVKVAQVVAVLVPRILATMAGLELQTLAQAVEQLVLLTHLAVLVAMVAPVWLYFVTQIRLALQSALDLLAQRQQMVHIKLQQLLLAQGM
jgi:hypothetical protein